ncbi:MBL fold metallo-hydrolase [Nonomuraea sp. KM90]|uniref:MBL fold metallo-hydrolase n=1 Tax=Nonomuraea sp. KM90 TaxID=3457428 RepID=UPI003FCDE459
MADHDTRTSAWPRSFRHRRVHSLPGLADLARIALRGGWTRRDLSEAHLLAVQRVHLLPVGPGEVALTWLGHASWLVRTATHAILIDPVLSPTIPGVRPRLTPPGLEIDELPTTDAVLISHDHVDHLDWPTVTCLDRRTTVIVPAKLGRGFRRRGFRQVRELDWWQHTVLDGLTLTCLPAAHWSGRTPWGLWRTLWASWLLTTGAGQHIYHAGDTASAAHFAAIGARYPGIDVALLPVGGYGPRFFQRTAHVDPVEAVRACADLGATRMALMHWATFVLSDEPLLEPRTLSIREWRRAGRPAGDLWAMAVGETRTLSAASTRALTPAATQVPVRGPAHAPGSASLQPHATPSNSGARLAWPGQEVAS